MVVTVERGVGVGVFCCVFLSSKVSSGAHYSLLRTVPWALEASGAIWRRH